MKKLIFILLFLPIIGFGQIQLFDVDSSNKIVATLNANNTIGLKLNDKEMNRILTLRKDSLSPELKMLYIVNNQWVSKAKTLKLKISDSDSGINNWRATIDGKWVLMRYNHKKNILTYNFNDKKLFGSKHIFKLVVLDNVLNKSTITKTFYRK